jgi:hypothetical protein
MSYKHLTKQPIKINVRESPHHDSIPQSSNRLYAGRKISATMPLLMIHPALTLQSKELAELVQLFALKCHDHEPGAHGFTVRRITD